MTDGQQDSGDTPRQPIFLLPGIVTLVIGILAAIHLARLFVLNAEGDNNLLIWLAFIPTRLFVAPAEWPGSYWPLFWSPFTHALLHADWVHLILNCAWLAIFGTPVARRYGATDFVLVFLIASAAGALAFLLTAIGSTQLQVLIGASGGIAGLTGVAIRFMFQPPVIVTDPATGRRFSAGRRAASLRELATSPRPRAFILMWVIFNAAVPLIFAGDGVSIAWHAHLGGFAAGLLLVPVLEYRGRQRMARLRGQ